MPFLRLISEEDDVKARRQMAIYRNLLIIGYVGFVLLAALWFKLSAASTDGFTVIAFFLVTGLAIAAMVFSYLISLVLAGILYRLRFPIWCIVLISAPIGPAIAIVGIPLLV